MTATECQATVPENAPDFEVATVKAEDLDTEASITYRLVAGDLDKFAVHPETGVVRTLRGLDFERSQHYEIIVGTEEGRMLGKQIGTLHFTHHSSQLHKSQFTNLPQCSTSSRFLVDTCRRFGESSFMQPTFQLLPGLPGQPKSPRSDEADV